MKKGELIERLEAAQEAMMEAGEAMCCTSINEEWAAEHPAMQEHGRELLGAAALIHTWIEGLQS